MEGERYISDGIGIAKIERGVKIEVDGLYLEISNYDWDLLKPLILEIFQDVLKHKDFYGYLHSNEIDNIIFKQNG
jgi:hypothetical protein